MKLSGEAAARYCAKPDPAKAGLLIYGGDAMRVALRRQEAIAALIGPEGEAEMRLTRLSGADARRDSTALGDAVKAQGFFAGPRVVFVEEAGDGIANQAGAALADWRAGDAVLVVTAGSLAAKSALRKVFEGNPATVAIGIYDDPPGRDEVEGLLKAAGLRDIDREAMGALLDLSRALDPGDFRQTVEKIALYKLGDAAPLTVDEIAVSTPATIEAGVDDLLHAAAEARTEDVGAVIRRLQGQGVAPVTICIQATRHFRTLHAASADPGGPGAGIARVRPPVFGPRRDRMLRQAQIWGLAKLEEALMLLLDTDLALRSTTRAPAMAVMERALIRLAMLGRR